MLVQILVINSDYCVLKLQKLTNICWHCHQSKKYSVESVLETKLDNNTILLNQTLTKTYSMIQIIPPVLVFLYLLNISQE